MKITDEMMAEAAAEMNEAMLRSLPDPDDCHHEFSRKFKRKMKRVVYRADHPVQFRIMQRVATIFLVICIGFATILTFSPTVRANVLGWIRERYESFVAYYFEDNVESKADPVEYCISDLPVEYTEIAVSDNEGIHTTVYSTNDGEVLYFSYSTSPDAANFFLKEDGYEIKKESIHGFAADIYLPTDTNSDTSIIWCEEDRNTIFFISGTVDSTELIDLAESVVPKK